MCHRNISVVVGVKALVTGVRQWYDTSNWMSSIHFFFKVCHDLYDMWWYVHSDPTQADKRNRQIEV